jgi:hypothetical protein
MSLNKNKNLAPVITRVFFAYAYNIGAINVGNDDNHKVVIFKPGKDWVEIYKVPKNVNFDELPKKTDAGILYDQKLSLIFPGDDESNITDLGDLEIIPLVIKFEYDNKKSRFFGDANNSVKASAPYSADRGGYSIVFECTSRNRAYWL